MQKHITSNYIATIKLEDFVNLDVFNRFWIWVFESNKDEFPIGVCGQLEAAPSTGRKHLQICLNLITKISLTNLRNQLKDYGLRKFVKLMTNAQHNAKYKKNPELCSLDSEQEYCTRPSKRLPNTKPFQFMSDCERADYEPFHTAAPKNSVWRQELWAAHASINPAQE